MKSVLALVAVIAGACHAQLDSARDQQPGDVDASTQQPPIDAPSGSPMIDAPQSSSSPDAPTMTGCSARVVFLNFDGVTLTYAPLSDATQNKASWIGVNTATVPPFLSGNANRQTIIDSIVTSVTQQLSSFPIHVTRTRPTSGNYVMIVFGGQRGNVGTNYTWATGQHDCGDLVKNDVGWVADVAPSTEFADLAIGAIGWGLGLNGTTDPNDCMCAWGNSCQPSTAPCTLSTAIQTSGSPYCNSTANPQNEVGAFHAAFCQ